MKLLTAILSLALLAIPARAQYAATKATTLSAAAEVITVQASASLDPLGRVPKVIAFVGFDVYCSVACTVTLERDGTAASTTTLAPVRVNLELPVPTALAFSSSNVGVGTVLGQYALAAGTTVGVKLAGKFLYSGTENLTIRTSSITGDVKINIQWAEQ